MTLHEAIQEVLIAAGRPMTTTEIADVINTRRSYVKRDGSLISPFQIHGRTKNYPGLFRQSGSSISLDHSAEAPPEHALLSADAFRLAGTIDHEVPDQAGLYAIRVRDRSALPEPFAHLSEGRDHDLLYVGIARKSLSRRFLGQELRARGHGTFFRSIGAVLGYRPPAGSLVGKGNAKNFSFAPTDEQEIIDWINQNLLVNWVIFSGDHTAEEQALVRKHLPLLNLQGNPAKLSELSAIRAECVRIANALF